MSQANILISARLKIGVMAFSAVAVLMVACTGGENPDVDATIAALPTSSPVVLRETVVETVVVTATAGPAPTRVPPAPTATPIVITVVATPAPPTPVPAPGVTSVEAVISGNSSLIAEVTVTLDSPARAFIEYSNPGAGVFRTAITADAGTKFVVPVLRLRAESEYSYTAYAVDADGNEYAGPGGKFTTGSLPDELKRIQNTVVGRPTPNLLLMDLRDQLATFLTVLDPEGNIVWYHQTANLVDTRGVSMNAIKQKDNYNFVYYAGRPANPCCLREVSPLGVQVDELVYSDQNKTPHHDFLILSNTEILYMADVKIVIDDTANGGAEDQVVVGDSMRIWDQKTGATREVWNVFDFWDPTDLNEREQWTVSSATGEVRWIHVNSLTQGPRGNYILSSRNRNQVFSVSSDFSEIEWQLGLGNEGSPRISFDWEEPADRFYRSHTATQLRNGNILVFDNGATRPEEEGGQYSRALEIAIDGYDLVARKVWEYRPDPDIYARNISSAWRLENGNTLINFGNRDDLSTQPVVAVEVTRTGDVVFRMETFSETNAGRFRVYALDSIMGERQVN